MCNKTVLDGQFCQNKTGICNNGQCKLNTTCTSNAGCDMNKNQYCADSNESCTKANPSQCATNLLVARQITVNGVTQIVYVSKMPVSWWDAEAMCDAKGGKKLLGVSELVSGWIDGNSGSYTRTSLAVALNEFVSGNAWTKMPYGDNSCGAYGVSLRTGYVYDSLYRRNNHYAVCR